MTRRLPAVTIVATVALASACLALAAPAMASDPTPAQEKLLLQPSDLPSSYGKATDASFSNVQEGGALASVCAAPDFAPASISVKDSQSMFSNVELTSGETWAQSIFVYASKAQARKAYGQLTRRSVADCTGSASTTKGDDGVTIPKRTTVVDASEANGMLITTAQSTSKNGGKAPYQDSFTRTVSVLKGNAIETLAVFGPKPISAAKAAKQDELLGSLTSRYKG